MKGGVQSVKDHLIGALVEGFRRGEGKSITTQWNLALYRGGWVFNPSRDTAQTELG